MEKQTAYVINLKHRTDRWEEMQTKWSPYFNLIRVDGIMLSKDGRPHDRIASEGLGLTHMKLLKEAKEQGLKTILILEDDAIPEPNWFERWVEIKEYLDTHLDEWDVFNGAVHFLRILFDTTKLKKSALLHGRIGCASHFMYLNLSAYDKFMKWTDDKIDIDMFYCNGIDQMLYCAYPILSKQANGSSDIMSKERSWDETYMCNEQNFKMLMRDNYMLYK